MSLPITLFGTENTKFMVLALIVFGILLILLLLGLHYLDKSKGRADDINSKVTKNAILIAAILLAIYALIIGVNLFKSGNFAESGTARLVSVMPVFIFASLIVAAYYGMKQPAIPERRLRDLTTALAFDPSTNTYDVIGPELDTDLYDGAFDSMMQSISEFKDQNIDALDSLEEYKDLVRSYNNQLQAIIPKELIDRMAKDGLKIPLVCNLVCSPQTVQAHARQIVTLLSSYFDTTALEIEKLREQLTQCGGENARLNASIELLTTEKNGYENILRNFEANFKLLSTTSTLVESVLKPVFDALEQKIDKIINLAY